MKRMILIVTLLAALAMTSGARAEEIILSTGSGPLDSVINPVKDAFEKDSGLKLNILFGSASLAFKQLYKGVSEAAMVGASFDEILEIMKKEGFKVTDPAALKNVVIGKAVVRTIVNRENPVSALSKVQLRGIFSGAITNWKEVGGKDSPIIVVLSTLNPATNAAFKKMVLEDALFTREVLELGHMDELRAAVEANPEAITFGTSAILSSGVKQLQTPEVYRTVTLITRGEPTAKVQKLIDYILKGPGRTLVRD
jgi:phosphate transport system substrate-binding protein